MSFKAYVIKVSRQEDVTTIENYLRDWKGAAFYSGAVKFASRNVFPKDSISLLLTVDRGDLRDSIVNEFGYKDFQGEIRRLEQFQSDTIEQDGQMVSQLRHVEYIYMDTPTQEAHFDKIREALCK